MSTSILARRGARPYSLAERQAREQRINTWVFLLPALIFFVWYQIYPIIRVVWISFTDFQFLSNEPSHWVGFDNYAAALSDPLMWASLWRAALFTMMFLPGTIIFPLLLAIRGVAGELPFQPDDDTPEPWGAGMAAEAARFRKR